MKGDQSPRPRVPLRTPDGVLRSTRGYSDSPQWGFYTRLATSGLQSARQAQRLLKALQGESL